MQHNERIKIKATVLNVHNGDTRPGCLARPPIQSARRERILDRAKLMSDLGFYSPKAKNEQETAPGTKRQPAIQLATFSNEDVLEDLKTQRQKDRHDALLRKELAKFRIEIEAKYRNSQMNNEYRFLRQGGEAPPDSSPEDVSSEPNCNNLSPTLPLVDNVCRVSTHNQTSDDNGENGRTEEQRATVDGRSDSPMSIKVRTHRKVPSTANFAKECFSRINNLIENIQHKHVDRVVPSVGQDCNSPVPLNKQQNKWPFLMLSIRKSPEKKPEPGDMQKYKTVARKSPRAAEKAIDFKRDLQDYIQKKEFAKPVALKLNTFKMMTINKDKQRDFLFSSRDLRTSPSPHSHGRTGKKSGGGSLPRGATTHRQQAEKQPVAGTKPAPKLPFELAQSPPPAGKYVSPAPAGKLRVTSLEKLIERLKEKQLTVNNFRVTLDARPQPDPTPKPKQQSQSRLRQSTGR